MAQNQVKHELENCYKYYRDFDNLKWLIKLLYNFRRDLLAKNSNTKVSNSSQELTDQIGSFKIHTSELVNIVQEILDQIKTEHKNKHLSQDLDDWSKNFKAVVSDYQDQVKTSEIRDLIDDLHGQFPAKRDFTNLILTFALSTSLELQGIKKFVEDHNTVEWRSGHCPICHSMPHYGLLRSDDGKKLLECWLCGIQWEYPRLKCPYCDSENQNQLGFFTLEADDLCRVQFCKECASYHKVFDLRKTGPIYLLEMHNYASLTHDFNAEKEGFQPGSGLSWVNEGELINT